MRRVKGDLAHSRSWCIFDGMIHGMSRDMSSYGMRVRSLRCPVAFEARGVNVAVVLVTSSVSS